MAGGSPVVRPTARVLLVDDRDRALLFSSVSEDDGRTFWYPPGGGLEPGESYEQAAVREVREETGLLVKVDSVLAHRRDVRTLAGTTYDFIERWFLVRVPATSIDTGGFTELERSTIEEHRWWSVDELRATTDRLTPTMLADLLAALLRDGPPADPWHLGR